MKRSEMVELLKNSVYNHMNSEDSIEDNEVFSRVLHDLEDKGMLPPFHTETYYQTWRDGGSGYIWEKEE